MMNERHLFLFGGSPPFNHYSGKKFADLSFGNKGKIAILFLERKGWKAYMPLYTSVLEEYGLHKFLYIPLISNPDVQTIHALKSCTGIIICGGDTEMYQKLMVDSLYEGCLKEMYNRGIPVAGFSAGALISPVYCVIPPIDNSKKEHLFLKGLGLVDCVISVHFSKWKEESNLISAIKKTNVPIGYGIDDNGVLYFKSEELIDSESKYYYPYKR